MEDVITLTGDALAVAGLLLLASTLLSRVGHRLGVPVSLFFLAIGMLAGSDGPGGIWFDRFDVSYICGTSALVLILFAGGLNTQVLHLRQALAPAGVLATVGVVGIAAVSAVGAHAVGLAWTEALLFGAIVSCTDAAAVFAVLDGVPLRRRVALTIELESGLNDPVAVILTVAATAYAASGVAPGWRLAADIALQLAVGAAVGVGLGAGARWTLARVRLSTPALFPVLTVAVAMICFGVASVCRGSGFLAVYLAGIVIGQGALPYKLTLQRFHDSLAWLAQIAMFLLLGLLVFPAALPAVAGRGLLLALFLALVARPLVVTVCLLPFGFAWREIACIAWLGLRGAVPIILATIPVLTLGNAGAPVRDLVNAFDLVFFVVVVGSFIPGMTVRYLPRLLRLEEPLAPTPVAAIDISSERPIREAQLNLFIGPAAPALGRTLLELALPEDAAVMLIVRGDHLIAPRGATRFELGDHAFVICPPQRAEEVTAAVAGPA